MVDSKLKMVLADLAVRAVAGWAAGSIMGMSAYAYVTKDLHPSRASLEIAVVEEFKGTQSFDEILRSQGLQIKQGYNETVATVSVPKALANACGTPQFDQNPVCERYGEIPRQLEKNAAASAKHNWLRNINIGYMAGGIPVTFIWLYGLLPYAFEVMNRKRQERQQA